MDPLTAALVIGGIALATRKQTDNEEVFDELNPGDVPPPSPGDPKLEVTKISKIFHRVDFNAVIGGKVYSFSHKQKDMTEDVKIIGNYVVRAKTISEGEDTFKDDPVILVIANKAETKVYTAKKVLIQQKKVIDLK